MRSYLLAIVDSLRCSISLLLIQVSLPRFVKHTTTTPVRLGKSCTSWRIWLDCGLVIGGIPSVVQRDHGIQHFIPNCDMIAINDLSQAVIDCDPTFSILISVPTTRHSTNPRSDSKEGFCGCPEGDLR
jgi:hypothetical protein